MSKGIPIPEFYNLVQPKQENISVNVLIDFYPIIDTLYSLHTQNKNHEIDVKFNSLYNYWSDGKTYRKESIILSRSEQLAQLSNELLTILKIKLKENPFDWQDDSYRKLEKIKNFIEYSDMYIETILCFIHSKASLEIESFQKDKVLTDYVKYLQQIIIKLYFNAIDNPKDKLYNSNFLKYLALQKSDELKNFLKLHGEKYNTSDFQIYLFNQLQLNSYYDNNYQTSNYSANLIYKDYENDEIDIAILLRDTLFKIESISQLLEKLKKGNIEWSADNNHIEELKLFLSKDKR
jgi:hypothetical protein